MRLAYTAYDLHGKTVSNKIEAPGVAEATEELRRQGLFVAEILQDRDGAEEGRRSRMGAGRRLKNLAGFTRYLQVLIASGSPVVQALESLERQSRDLLWREVIADVRRRVEEGSTLAEAMGEHPDCFDPVCCSLITAGESSGSMAQMLDRLAALVRRQLHVRKAIAGALVYPCLLMSVAVGVLLTMLLFVLPRFTMLFESLDAPQPPTTRMLVALSDLLRGYWWGLLAAAVAAVVLARLWVATEAGRRAYDLAMLRMPLTGKLFQGFIVARITRVLGVLVVGKVPMLEALRLAKLTAGNFHYVSVIARAEESVSHGGSLSASFGESDLIAPSLCEAIRSGEQNGQVGPLLLQVSDFLDEENEVVIRTLASVLEPLILIALGLIVGFVALSMFLPLFDLAGMTEGGST